eukprot:TRINITY_DN11550_c0_g1_i1.p1 TRINITY_DN11550_c0_g1~~TRINITY_DN11550_c0_g1_i1.p1  ORF type:complete len:395 (-),score=91.77 TRINITY_DN11550_c0_g1_i1:120-1268(-)
MEAKRRATLFLVTVIVMTAVVLAKTQVQVPKKGGSLTFIDVFHNGEEGYSCFRIPALLLTQNGTLIAFCEARKFSCQDHGYVDIVTKRSFDQGQTWTGLQVVYSNSTDNGEWNTIGNAAPVQDRLTGDVILVFCRNNLQVMGTRSSDDGQSWEAPQNVSNVVDHKWKWVGTGPPGSLQLSSGRILVPCYHQGPSLDGWLNSQSHVMYSDDSGKSWQLGTTVQSKWRGNECQAAPLVPYSPGSSNQNNSFLLNMRSDVGYRLLATSYDGGQTFTEPELQKELTETLGGCEGSTILHSTSGLLLFSNPSVPSYSPFRFNMSLHTSSDAGRSWQFWGTIWEKASGYSSLVELFDHSVSVIFERANTTHLIQEPQVLTYVPSFFQP